MPFDRIMYVCVVILMLLLVGIILYPLIYVLSSSFSSGKAVTSGKVLLLPVDPSLAGYRTVFSYKAVWVGMPTHCSIRSREPGSI